MPKLALAQVLPGQKLARPVTSPSGVILVQAGTELTPALVDRLRGLGIDVVTVASEDGTVEDRPVEDRLRELDARFAGHEEDPVMMQIKDVVARQLKAGSSTDHA